MNNAIEFDALVIGGGPAGCACATWLHQLGLRCALVERQSQLCEGLAGLDYGQDWVLGEPHTALKDLAAKFATHVRQQTGVELHLGQSAAKIARLASGIWQVVLSNGQEINARRLVLATGVQPLRPVNYFNAQNTNAPVLDAIRLTQQRATLAPSRILLLGGGDNAVENALYLHERGHQVTLWTRNDWRAQPRLRQALEATPSIVQRRQQALPELLHQHTTQITVGSEKHGTEVFDRLAVLFGFRAEPSAWDMVLQGLQADGVPTPQGELRPTARLESLGLFIAGDASGRLHPCVQTALADGVVAAKQVEQSLAATHRAGLEPQPTQRQNRQVLNLSGLRFGANLGLLDHERQGPQPIQVDAELNLGEQAILTRDADIGHVLDYRRVRQIIIDECTAEHIDLLEAMLGKICERLLRLPGVMGVRVKVTKLEIFDDCEVAISAECGQW